MADTADPTIVAVGPTSGTTDAAPLIRATVGDTSVNPFRSNIRLFVGGGRTTRLYYDRSSGKLSHRSEKLEAGRHQVKVEATDAAGNEATGGWSIVVKKRR